MRMLRHWLGAGLIAIAGHGYAGPHVTGTFEAVRACEAYKSFKKGQNPGNVKLAPGQTYEALEVNNTPWHWIRVIVPDSDFAQRWVSKACGIAAITLDEPHAAGGGGSQRGQCATANTYDSYVLALTWQPGFCEHVNYRGRKPECDALADGELTIGHLTLHGLWPNKDACGTRYGNCGGPALDLEDDTVTALAPYMPNFYYGDKFGAYEWRKHGVCQALDDDDYFMLALKLLKQVNDSAIGAYLKAHVGDYVSLQAFKAVIEQAGDGLSDHMQVQCAARKYFQELRINLPKTINLGDTLAETVSGAKTFDRFAPGCADEIYIERSGPG